MKDFLKNNWFKIILIIALLWLAYSIFNISENGISIDADVDLCDRPLSGFRSYQPDFCP